MEKVPAGGKEEFVGLMAVVVPKFPKSCPGQGEVVLGEMLPTMCTHSHEKTPSARIFGVIRELV